MQLEIFLPLSLVLFHKVKISLDKQAVPSLQDLTVWNPKLNLSITLLAML